jgi:hypothetical protein
MKKLLPLIVLILAAGVFGQATIADLQTKAKTTKTNKDLLISYDKFKDKSVVSTKPQNLIGGMEAFAVGMVEANPGGARTPSGYPTVLLLQMGFTFRGDTLKETPSDFLMTFTSSSTGWVFLKGDKNLYILYDGERLEMHPIGEDRDIWSTSVGETLGFTISREMIAKLIEAKNIEMKLGDTIPRKWKPEWSKRIQALLTITKL